MDQIEGMLQTTQLSKAEKKGVRVVEEMEMKSEMGVARAICKVMAEKPVCQEIVELSLGKI